MITIEPPKNSTRWNLDELKYPHIWAAFERATRIKIRKAQLLRKDPHCRYCGKRLTAPTATMDHVVPESLGGTDDRDNLVLACHFCNQAKADRTILEWVTDILCGPTRT
jgi:hypothetical protein